MQGATNDLARILNSKYGCDLTKHEQNECQQGLVGFLELLMDMKKEAGELRHERQRSAG